MRAERMTGVRTTCGPIRAAAATTSAKSGSRAFTAARSGPGEQVLTVVR